MSRSVLILAVAAVASAGLVALVSRAPEELRARRPLPTVPDPDRGAAADPPTFSDEEIHRHAAYRGPSYLAVVLSMALEIATLVVIGLGPFRSLVTKLERAPGGWLAHVVLAAVALTVILVVVRLPLAFVRDYTIEHAWHRSTQDLWGWVSDRAKGLTVGAVVAGVSAGVLFALVRGQPRWWWVTAWGAFTALAAAFTFLWPLVIAPWFNRFTPLQDGVLAARARAMAAEVGVDLDEVLVADASRRTTGENAYVAGVGGSKRLVLYDTLVDGASNDEVSFVVAHELGHEARGHIVKMLVLTSAGLLAGFAVLTWLAQRPWSWSWTGASGISDPRLLPALLVFVAVATLISLPFQNALSRTFEREADAIALRLSDEPSVAADSFRRLAYTNLADLRPPALAVWAFFTHPPIRERIETAVAFSERAP